MGTTLGLIGVPFTRAAAIPDKAIEGLPPFGTRIAEFDTWRPGYAGASILVVREGTNEHAPLYSDFGLTEQVSNPVVLLSYTAEDGVTYGKWPHPVYTYVAYFLTINETAPTGITRIPIYDIEGVNISLGIVATARGDRLRLLEDVLDGAIYAEAFGSLAEANGAEANGAALEAAIGAAAAQGAGEVILPAGRIISTPLTLPQGVVLRGQGTGATTLTITFGAPAVTLGGDGAGFRDLTLDGINLATGSVGVQGIGVVAAIFEHVVVKRFDIGVRFRGITNCAWETLYVTNCVTGMDLRGDTDAAGTALGGVVRGISWTGGGISLCTTAGLKLTFFDAPVENIALRGVDIIDNLGDGVLMNGARNVSIDGASRIRAAEGQRAVKIQDDTNLALVAINTTDHITFRQTICDGGTWLFNGTCASVVLERCDLRAVSLDLSVPNEVIVLDNCIEDAAVTLTGDTTKLMRAFVSDDLQVVGNTTDAVPTVAWSHSLEPGEMGFYEAAVLGQRQDGIAWGIFMLATGVARAGADLLFNLQTANFTAGATVSGATSGATARIAAVTQAAGSGTLTLADISGTFVNGEVLTDGDGGDARADGTITTSNAALDGGGSTDIRTQRLSGTAAYDAYFDVSGAKVRLMVLGDTSHAVQWTARVRALAS